MSQKNSKNRSKARHNKSTKRGIEMTLEQIIGKKVANITDYGVYWVLLEDNSAIGFAAELRQIDTATFQTGVAIHTLPAPAPDAEPAAEAANE